MAAPQVDLAASRLFYDPAAGFFISRYGFLDGLRNAAQWLEIALPVAMLLVLPLKYLFPDFRLPFRPRAILFIVVSVLVGPLLIVNLILKDYWGRARPREIFEFGGHAMFSPAWRIAGQCARNCSFVSGEASSAFWLIAFVFIVPREWRKAVAVAALAITAVVSLERLAVGGHFLSDIVIGWLLTLLVVLVCYRLVIERLPATFDRGVEDGLARGGRAFRRLFASSRRPT